MQRYKFHIIFVLYFILGFMISKRHDHAAGQFLYLEGYVSEIDTPKHGNDTTRKLLNEFSSMGNGFAVSYKDEHIIFHREIHIREVSLIKNTYPKNKNLITIGLTHVGTDQCLITVLDTLPDWEYREVLFHEYCHCMGYPDLFGKKYQHDLMYYVNNSVDQKTIKWYSIDIGEKVYTWKNLLNLSSSIKQIK
jgi:hypothetical protein